jgi:hypothetical protein
MQKAIRRFLRQTKILQERTPEKAAQVVLDFWGAVAIVLRNAWDAPRRHLINKGVGVYALMGVAADLYLEALGQTGDKRYFVNKLSEFITEIDWTTSGALKGFGGEGGVTSALEIIRTARAKRQRKVVAIG